MPSDHMGVSIDPDTLADGTLYHSLDPAFYLEEGPDGTVTDGADPVGALGTPTVTATGSGTGGTLAAATYFYKVLAVGEFGPGETSAEVSVTTTGTTSSVALNWANVAGETAGYKVYRSTATGDELHLGDVAHGTHTFTDTGAVTPSGAIPAESDEAKAGEKLNEDAPQPVDAGATAVEGEDDNATPTEGGTD